MECSFWSNPSWCHKALRTHKGPAEKTLASQGHLDKLPWEVDEMVIQYSETSSTQEKKHISIFHSWGKNTFE